MRAKTVQAVLLLLSLVALAASKDESLDALKARALRENEPRLYAEVVRRQVEVANEYYTAGDVQKAQGVVAEIMDLTGKCVDAAQKKHSKLKDTELTLYRASRRLQDVRRSLAFDDQPPVQAAVDRIEKARRHLLDLMFQPDKPKPEEKKP
jgi:tRNA A37 N6-isopentenylltransferase MiaA